MAVRTWQLLQARTEVSAMLKITTWDLRPITILMLDQAVCSYTGLTHLVGGLAALPTHHGQYLMPSLSWDCRQSMPALCLSW